MPGEVSERLKERDWKSRGRLTLPRGFESLPLRSRLNPRGWGLLVAMGTTTPQASRLWRLSHLQHGVLTRGQMLAFGYSPAAVRHRIAKGRLHPVHRGVYAVGLPELSRYGTWMAAVLSCGPRAVLSHASA